MHEALTRRQPLRAFPACHHSAGSGRVRIRDLDGVTGKRSNVEHLRQVVDRFVPRRGFRAAGTGAAPFLAPMPSICVCAARCRVGVAPSGEGSGRGHFCPAVN
ncbi:MAG: hypothetical protein KDF95_11820 [Rhodocyclaceae bacterium]|nr:hypothetical protein [Rhodocyclaceae bacterium]